MRVNSANALRVRDGSNIRLFEVGELRRLWRLVLQRMRQRNETGGYLYSNTEEFELRFSV